MTLRQTLASLPRDARDTLFLLVVIAVVVAPQAGNLPGWASALTGAVLLWRGRLAWLGKALPGSWTKVLLVVLAVAGTLYSHRTILGRDAGVTLIVMLLALKTLELHARRDALVVFFLGFFTMLSNFFFSQSLLTAGAMLVALLGLLTALVNAHMPVGRPPLVQTFRMAGSMALLGAPIMVALFMLFPRMSPLWGMPGDNLAGRSGLSGTMKVGDMAEIALDDRVAIRLKFEGGDSNMPPQSALYFRGPVLTAFDGREWQAEPFREDSAWAARVAVPASLQVSGPAVRYEVTLEPQRQPWLMVLEATPEAPALPGMQAYMTQDLQWMTTRPITEVLRYQAVSYPSFRHGPDASSRPLRVHAELPPGFNPRTLALAAQMRADPALANADTQQLVNAVLQRLRTGGYSYSLDPGVFGEHTADEFWFDRKEGFCEHISSAFVVLMRALDVPSRIVTGYQGGERNPVDGYWTIRNADAHAWAEVWVENRGWVRVDPTGAIAPSRIGAFQRLRAPQGAFANAMGTISPGLAQNLRAVWEAVNNRWNQWVLNYSQARQLDLLKALGFESPSWQDLTTVLGVLVMLAALGGGAWTLWERSQHDPWLRLMARTRQRLARAGLTLPDTLPPRAMADRVRAQFGASSQPVADWLLRLEHLRYAPHPTQALGQLRREFGALPWPEPPKH
ncbi:transglutaminaseTgpA domain-containing protein [Paracidovorax sp. MALMAid1276]|uniref:transglutaminase family protein n=1 Tax=Paracidovorax sp. MALMAid1276 TaxID=3411631 RepID=UPI003B9CB1D8